MLTAIEDYLFLQKDDEDTKLSSLDENKEEENLI